MSQLLDILNKLHTVEGDTIWYEENVTLDELIKKLKKENKGEII